MVTINSKERLYVIQCVGGYSCLGFYVAEERHRAVADWMKSKTLGPQKDLKGTKDGYEMYEGVMRLGEAYAKINGTRCPADLTSQLDGLEGKRVEVVDKYGEKRRFIVGRSTGWFPCHLEIARRTSSGGSAVTGAPFRSVRVV